MEAANKPDSALETAPDAEPKMPACAGDPEQGSKAEKPASFPEGFEEFTLDELEVIESKVFA